jgi:hypothetical protein
MHRWEELVLRQSSGYRRLGLGMVVLVEGHEDLEGPGEVEAVICRLEKLRTLGCPHSRRYRSLSQARVHPHYPSADSIPKQLHRPLQSLKLQQGAPSDSKLHAWSAMVDRATSMRLDVASLGDRVVSVPVSATAWPMSTRFLSWNNEKSIQMPDNTLNGMLIRPFSSISRREDGGAESSWLGLSHGRPCGLVAGVANKESGALSPIPATSNELEPRPCPARHWQSSAGLRISEPSSHNAAM